MGSIPYYMVYTTYPTAESAYATARYIIEKRYASCVNVLSPAKSFYEWEGQVKEVAEVCMIAKTNEENWENLRKALEQTHPYEIPAISAIPMSDANSSFLDWIDQQVA